MRLGRWLRVGLALAGLQAGGTAPRLPRTKVLGSGAASALFVDRPDFFDYPDSDRASLLAVAQFIGEKPVEFAQAGPGPGLFHCVLVGVLLVALFYLLLQFCTHMSCQKGA